MSCSEAAPGPRSYDNLVDGEKVSAAPGPGGTADERAGAEAANCAGAGQGLQWLHSLATTSSAAQRLKPAKALGWVAIGLSILILMASAALRVSIMFQSPPPTEAFDVRYAQHPGVALLHLAPGLLFLGLGWLQLVPRVRNRHLSFHGRLGRLLVGCAILSGVLGLVASFRLPAFGGLSTQVATAFFGTIFLFSVTRAFVAIRRKQVKLHREWMIRTYALAMGVATVRVVMGPLLALSGLGIEAVFGTSFWLGWSINLLVAEVWINKTRVGARRPAPSPRS